MAVSLSHSLSISLYCRHLNVGSVQFFFGLVTSFPTFHSSFSSFALLILSSLNLTLSFLILAMALFLMILYFFTRVDFSVGPALWMLALVKSLVSVCGKFGELVDPEKEFKIFLVYNHYSEIE